MLGDHMKFENSPSDSLRGTIETLHFNMKATTEQRDSKDNKPNISICHNLKLNLAPVTVGLL